MHNGKQFLFFAVAALNVWAYLALDQAPINAAAAVFAFGIALTINES